MRTTRIVRSLPLVLLVTVAVGVGRFARSNPVDDMAGAAQRLLDALSPEQRPRAAYPFEASQRTDWNFVPMTRPGVTIGEMSDLQRSAARGLLHTALSSKGTLKVEAIMALDGVLRDMEQAAGGDGAKRDPLAYAFAVFGTPGRNEAWGWRIEGHHISLNFTCRSGAPVSVTPSFLGSNPAEIRRGPHAGQRALGGEEDLGRELVASLDESQRTLAIIAKEAPSDVLTLPGRSMEAAPSVGLPASKLTPPQRAVLEQLLAEFAGNLRRELADQELERIRAAGMDQVRFAWAGGTEKGQPHYYRLSGPTFVIEYDNTQNDANHIHTVWHDRHRDFGRDLLREHYDHDDHQPATPAATTPRKP